MLSFNPLSQRDFLGGIQGWRYPQSADGRVLAGQQATTVSKESVQSILTMAYQRIESAVQGRFPAVKAANAPVDSSAAAKTSTPENDYSPQAVADRVLGFIKDRLTKEQANGATPEKLKDLYQQALKGVEKGLREGRDIIQGQGQFSGDVKNTFYQTVNLIADGLQELGENLFGASLDASSTAPATNRIEASHTQVAFARSQSFDMEIVTKEGDKIKIQVQAGQSFDGQLTGLRSDALEAEMVEANYSSANNFAFSVEGDLNEGELAALNDLFSQVNDVASSFYGGDVEAAFNQAMSLGIDPDQLASVAVNMNQSESVAVRSTYASVQNMAGQGANNPHQAMLDTLGKFAGKARAGADAVASNPDSPRNGRALYADLLGRMHSGRSYRGGDHGGHHGGHHRHGDAFSRFANRLAG